MTGVQTCALPIYHYLYAVITFPRGRQTDDLVNCWAVPVSPGHSQVNELSPCFVAERLAGILLHHSAVAIFLVAVSLHPVMIVMLLLVSVTYFVVPEVFSYSAYLYLGLLFLHIPVLVVLLDTARAR